MRKNLVVVRCGPDSFHPAWLAGQSERNWDLLLCPYAESPGDSDFPVPPVASGQKWSGLHALLARDPIWRAYDYVWLPDDDLEISGSELSRFFDLCHRFDAKLAAPSLSEDSFFTYPITMHNRAFFARATNFVEIMAPCFRRDVLEAMLPTFATSRTGLGWGLDFAWPNLLEHRGVCIFDAVQMRHGRAVGAARSPAEERAGLDERRHVAGSLGGRFTPRTLYPCDEAGQRVGLEGARLLIEYLKGYEYLTERAPHILDRLMFHQMAGHHRSRRRDAPRPRTAPLRGALWRLFH